MISTEIKLAVIVGSKSHFIPGGLPPQTGIGHLLSDLYDALLEIGVKAIHYYDATDKFLLSPEAIMFSLENGFMRAKRRIRPAVSILISVNQIRCLRPMWLSKALLKNPLAFRYISAEDNLFTLSFPEYVADYIFQLGEHNVGEICEFEPGISKRLVSFHINRTKSESNYIQRNSSDKKILFFLGSVCLRKGWFQMGIFIRTILNNLPEHVVVIHGRATNSRICRELTELICMNPGKVTWSQKFLDTNSIEFQELFDGGELAIFPSLEEGQQDAVLTAIHAGIPVLCSERAGYSQILRDSTFDIHDHEDVLTKFLNLVRNNPSYLVELQKSQEIRMKSLVSTKASFLDSLSRVDLSLATVSPKFSHFSWIRGFIRFPVTNAILTLCRLGVSISSALQWRNNLRTPR